jgi:hypothetical protein
MYGRQSHFWRISGYRLGECQCLFNQQVPLLHPVIHDERLKITDTKRLNNNSGRTEESILWSMPYTKNVPKLKLAFLGQAQCRHAERSANRVVVVRRQLEWTGRHLPVSWITGLPFLPNVLSWLF